MSKAPNPKNSTVHPDPHAWIKHQEFKTTADVQVPPRLIDQVIGQDQAVEVAVKAAEQKRHLMLIGDPGTGKSMLAKAMAEILPPERQEDILTYHNVKSPNSPKIAKVPGGDGRAIVQKYETKANRVNYWFRVYEWTVAVLIVAGGLALWLLMDQQPWVFLFALLLAMLFIYFSSQKRPKGEFMVPKLLIEHGKEPERAPYVEGTGSHAGALLGDVRHDPYQSGGLETPPHQRVEVGAIHRGNKGVVFIDEINTLRLPSQQALLTALQEKTFPIVGQSQSSAGAMVRTQAVPCDFILVAAGNLDAVRVASEDLTGGMHPALRSRIRGYGYEVFVNNVMEDTHENRIKLVRFVAQEVVRDGKIPHFDQGAVAEIIREAQRRSGRTGKLTLRLRELGGMVRTAGDIARSSGSDVVGLEHVRGAKASSRSLEQQIADKQIESFLDDEGAQREGSVVGIANGVAIVGTGEVGEPAGLVVPVEAAVVPAISRSGGAIVMGQGLKERHGTGVENVGAVLKVLKGAAIANYDLHVDASIHHPDASAEGIGIAAAVAAISALESLPVRQDVVLIGTLAVSGAVRPVRATLQRIEAAATLGYKEAIVPEAIRESLLLDEPVRNKIQVTYCRTLGEVLDHALDTTAAAKREIVDRLAHHAIQNGHATPTVTLGTTTVATKSAKRAGPRREDK